MLLLLLLVSAIDRCRVVLFLFLLSSSVVECCCKLLLLLLLLDVVVLELLCYTDVVLVTLAAGDVLFVFVGLLGWLMLLLRVCIGKFTAYRPSLPASPR